MTTYTIACTRDGMLLVCVPDNADIEAALDAAGVLDRDGVVIEDGLTLTDDAEGKELVYRGFSMGHLIDESGTAYYHAVRP